MVANSLRAAVIAAAMASSACTGSIAAGTAANDAPAASVTQSIGPAPGRYAGALPDFAGLAEHYGPAVVNVAVVGKRQQVDLPEGLSPNDPFFEFFRRFGQPNPRGNGGGAPQARGGRGLRVAPRPRGARPRRPATGTARRQTQVRLRRRRRRRTVHADERADDLT